MYVGESGGEESRGASSSEASSAESYGDGGSLFMRVILKVIVKPIALIWMMGVSSLSRRVLTFSRED